MIKVNNSLLTSDSIGMFLKNMNIHNHNTRNKLDFHVIPHSQNIREFSIQIYGVKLWNNLPAFKKTLTTLIKFRSKLKGYLLLQ